MAGTQSLYRKHRPQQFSQLVGQEHVTTALKNSVRDNRVGHAYLFSGPRGTGKTTSARILAKALNCLDLQPDGEPCGKCENCVAITAGTFVDLFELDAASNNSVNDVRSLIERVNLGLAPNSKKKVYIIDEVHMLSSSSNAAAPNALLKTLEEPPDHVVFVLATTNPEKVLPTIRSRAQHFEFNLLTLDQLTKHLSDVLKAENVQADPEALLTIARRASGSARDALSLLDQALAHHPEHLGAEDVKALFGGTPFEKRLAILQAVAQENTAGALLAFQELRETGHEPRTVAEDLLRSLRDAFLLHAGQGKVQVDAPVDEQEQLRTIAEALGNGLLVRSMETLGQAIVDMRGTESADPRLVLEIALLRLARRESGSSMQVLTDRVEKLEQAEGPSVPKAEPNPSGDPPASDNKSSAPITGARKALGALRRENHEVREVIDTPLPATLPVIETVQVSETAKSLNLDDVILAWAEVLPTLSMASRATIQEVQPVSVEEDVIIFGVPPRLLQAAKPRFQKEADGIRSAFGEKLGTRVRFKLVVSEDLSPQPNTVDLTSVPINDTDDYVPSEEIADTPPKVAVLTPVDKLMQAFGAEVVEETTHE